MSENKSKNRAWLLVLTGVLVPIMVAIINNSSCNLPPPPPPPCEKVYTIKGTAFYKDGRAVIANVPISVISQVSGQQFTASDGSFMFKSVKGDCKLASLKIGVEIDGEWTTITVTSFFKGDEEIDLGEVVFPLTKSSQKKETTFSKPKSKEPVPPPKPSYEQLTIKYPTEVRNPIVKITPNPIKTKEMVTSCALTISKGVEYGILLHTQKGVWRANFSDANKGFFPGNKFTFHPNY